MDISNDYRIGSLDQSGERKVKDNAVLDQDDFLKIIAANISNPPIPGSDGGGSGSETDFMGQMIQMNLLEQVTDLTTSIQSTMLMTHQQQALSLVGKQVTITTATKDGDKEVPIIGIVEKVRFSPDGMSTIRVKGKDYSMQSVTAVSEAGFVEDEVEANPEIGDVEGTEDNKDVK